ncbi:TerB family tellurite resistance protein [Ningiella sp. W23]|uniref:tellurite resistance TerB family protein n=1 Tax=Ningiella sp. W23 TaxID=3023715 RepID=UPI003756B511
MIDKLKAFFSLEIEIKDEKDTQNKLQHACAALLFEVIKADFEQTAEETEKVKHLLRESFDLSDAQLNELMIASEQNSAETTSVYPFTTLIKEEYEYEQRVALITLMWKVAYADGSLDHHEDDVIRRVADLLYVRHSDFIQAKLAVSGDH